MISKIGKDIKDNLERLTTQASRLYGRRGGRAAPCPKGLLIISR